VDSRSGLSSLFRARIAAGLMAVAVTISLAGCADDTQIETLRPATLTVAVTSGASANEHDPQQWVRRYVEAFAQENDFRIDWVVVPFDESWLLAGRDEVDLVATNVASFPDRASAGATFSRPFLYERRALRIRPGDRDRYDHIGDFVGRTVGVVSGMAAERDVDRRAPGGVIVRRTGTFAELYAEFDAGRLDAIAEAEYYSLDGRVIPSHGDEVVLIDHHDLTPGQREESVFVIRNRSRGLLEAVNAFIESTPFPL